MCGHGYAMCAQAKPSESFACANQPGRVHPRGDAFAHILAWKRGFDDVHALRHVAEFVHHLLPVAVGFGVLVAIGGWRVTLQRELVAAQCYGGVSPAVMSL